MGNKNIGIFILLLSGIFVIFSIDIYINGEVWLFGIILLLLPPWPKLKRICKALIKNLKSKSILQVLIFFIPIVSFFAFINPEHSHRDEYILGYYGFAHDFRGISFFGPVPDSTADWITRFPSLQFYFQKIWLTIFGVNFLSLKSSSVIYIFVIGIVIYLISKRIVATNRAWISVLIYAFFAPFLYLNTFAIPNTYASLCLVAFVYSLIRLDEKKNVQNITFTAVTLGLCFLNYEGAWLAAPVFVVYQIYAFVKNRKDIKKQLIEIVLITMFTLTICFGYIAWAIKNNDMYMVRTQEVIAISNNAGNTYTLENNILNPITAVFKDGMSGVDDYWYGHQAYLSPINAIVLIPGIVLLLISKDKKTKIVSFLLLSSIVFGVIFSYILVKQPPGIHRIIMISPFVIICMAYTFSELVDYRRIGGYFLLTLVVISNIYELVTINQKEYPRADYAPIYATELRDKQYKGYLIEVIGYQNYAFSKYLYFLENKREAPPEDLSYYIGNYSKFRDEKIFFAVLKLNSDEENLFTTTYANIVKLDFSDPYLAFYIYSAGK